MARYQPSRRRLLNPDGSDPAGTDTFDLGPISSVGLGGRSELRPAKPPKAAGYGVCPECHTVRRVGYVKSGRHYTWKLHHKNAGKARMLCHASGAALHDVRPVSTESGSTKCFCETIGDIS